VQATLYQVDALQNAVKVQASKGQKTHTWLSRAEVIALLDTCNGDTLKAEQDRLALGLLLAAGLRRAEAVALTFADAKLQPVGDRMRTVLAIQGKGKKNRTVPISDALANAIDRWGPHVRHEGRVLRSLDQGGNLRESMTAVAVYNVVQEHGAAMGKPDLAPHDLRRSYAQIGYESGIPLTQISTLLGHANVATTQRYLNLALDLESTISDFIPF
jgi:integrase/recombinase XerD